MENNLKGRQPKSKLFKIAWNGKKITVAGTIPAVCKTFVAKHEKNQSCSELHGMAGKLVKNIFWIFSPLPPKNRECKTLFAKHEKNQNFSNSVILDIII